jgi:hypothetical protein
MFFDGYIAAPPTITVFSSARAGATKVEVIASTLKAAAERNAIRLDMECLPIGLVTGGHPPMKGATRVLREILVRVAPSLSRITGGFGLWFPEIILCDG